MQSEKSSKRMKESRESKEAPLAAYNRLVASGELKPDAVQEKIARELDGLAQSFILSDSSGPPGIWARLFGKKPAKPSPGLYIHGDVGRGKSMLMDIFYDAAPVGLKRRVHFHAFMLECHQRIHQWRQSDKSDWEADGKGDPIPPLAQKIAEEAQLLCFDEFQVNDVADAMILGRLYQELFERGVVVVSTSNRPPDALYEDGPNRASFLPFIAMIKDRMRVFELCGPTDYRLERMKGLQVYYTPVNEETTNHLRKAFFSMTDRNVEDSHKVPSEEIEIQGRRLFVPKSARGVAVFSFKRLCSDALGAADYLAIAWRYHTVFVVAIPEMGPEQRNEARRFITLIDSLYENNVKLFCSAAVEPEKLYQKGAGSFEFERTASRLIEMQSAEYLARGHAV